ncbi:MAG TPA: sensor domain-containing diguanylate cyclase [Solirubrobacterales bacterium]|jgi:diguanylate cyclase (GGDEF)-like protein/PAS domain S-box-containing protein|nr:sensor domain-containing diguanylate cyclase [Solirubrobacterales bacterium]
MASPQNRVTLDPAGGSEVRAAAALLIAGAGLVALSLLLPHPSGGNSTALMLTAAAMAAAGVLCSLFVGRIPRRAVHPLLGGIVALTGLLILESGIAVGQYGTIFVWATLISSYYFPRRVAALHFAWLLLVYGLVLLEVESTAGYSPLTRWIFTLVSLGVVMLLTTAIVARRARADERARRFFDLSRDMLCTANLDGYFVELNDAWTKHLGYGLEELRAIPFVERVHPDDRERTEVEAASLFEGTETSSFENRYLAKDGTWHWLRWSSQLSQDESLIYARAADVTELKQIEAEREELLDKVQDLAVHDPLTGLPNRRALEEQLPREMARARRSGSPLCVAIVDIDCFKLYNDTHGHLAGDEVLRECACAWDEALRGEDTIVRFGGEEFLVLLPGTAPEEATEVVERLRKRTPRGQTCSAGLACWDSVESVDDLLGRADRALYLAKAAGRDQLARAAAPA